MTTKSPARLWIAIAVLLLVGFVLIYKVRNVTPVVDPAATPAAVARETSRTGGPAAPGADVPASVAAACRAIEKGDAAALESALRGIDIDGRYQLFDSGGRQMTLLTYAATQPGSQAVRMLLAAGARTDVASDDGVTPLWMAAARSDGGAVEALLAAGAAVDAANKWDETPLMNAARSGQAANARALLQAGASVAARDHEGSTPLMLASAPGGTPELLQLLIDAGADVNAAGELGVTPLMRAAESGDAAKCAVLLNAGAQPDLRDSDGRTALDRARLRRDESGERCASFLAQAGG